MPQSDRPAGVAALMAAAINLLMAVLVRGR